MTARSGESAGFRRRLTSPSGSPTIEAVLGVLATADIRSQGPAQYCLLDSVRALGLEWLHKAGLTAP